MGSDERLLWHFNPTFGSSHIASSAYQKWPTKNSHSVPYFKIKQVGLLTNENFNDFQSFYHFSPLTKILTTNTYFTLTARYIYETGEATLYHNGKQVGYMKIGTHMLATQVIHFFITLLPLIFGPSNFRPPSPNSAPFIFGHPKKLDFFGPSNFRPPPAEN